jgi:DNA-binding transcriptional LysR family regulator
MNIELRHLRYFTAVAEESSFTGAARRMHVTQQVLSAQVRQLEETLGVQLLERTSKGVVLTPAGAAFLDSARDTLASLDRAVAAAHNAARAVRGELAVGLSVAAGGELPTALLAAFQQAEPEVEVRLRTFELDQPAAGLLDHSTDVSFVRPPVAAPGIRLQKLAEEPRVFVLPSGHPLAARPSLTMADVAGLPWIVAEDATDGSHPTRWRDEWLVQRRPRGDQPVIGAVARTIDEWRELVVAGRGISLCPASAETYYARPGLAFVRADGVPPTALCAAWRAGDTNPVVHRFVEVVRVKARAAGGENGPGTAAARGPGERDRYEHDPNEHDPNEHDPGQQAASIQRIALTTPGSSAVPTVTGTGGVSTAHHPR